MLSRFNVFVFLIGILAMLPSSAAEVPDFGLMLNDDGDYSFVGKTPEESLFWLEASMDSLKGTPVKTLMYCVGAGSDTLYYPTKVASEMGWRKTRDDELADPPTKESIAWSQRIQMIRTGMQAGIDPIRVAGERAREMGLYFVPSYRMNDNHFMFNPEDYPLTGKFWLDNHAKLKIGDSPIASDNHYGNLFDYSHPEVRRFRLDVIKEIIERYGDIMDGIELDFNRVQVLFPRGKAHERANLVTEMMQEVRTLINDSQTKNGRKQWVFARVPPTPENCAWAGLDIPTWMDKRLVDVLLPSQLMTLAYDMPIDRFVALAEPAGCKIYPSLYPRTSWGWEFVAEPSTQSYATAAKQEVTPAQVRGAAANCRRMGADGFELFNFHHEEAGLRPYSDRLYRILRDLGDPAALNQANKLFAITPAYYLDHEDSYEYRKQVPIDLLPNKESHLTLFVGDDVANNPAPRYCGLRLGMSDLAPNRRLTVKLNDHVVHDDLVEKHLVKTTGKRPLRSKDKSVRLPVLAPDVYLQFDLHSGKDLRTGQNSLALTLGSGANDAVNLVDVTIGVLYDREFLKLIE